MFSSSFVQHNKGMKKTDDNEFRKYEKLISMRIN